MTRREGPQWPDNREPTLQEYCASLGASPPAAAMLFPMYVVRVPEVLRMVEMRPHEDLLARGIVEEYSPSLGVAVFVSHQWCSRSHPDPNLEQFSVLQGVLRRLGGDLQIQLDLLGLVFHPMRFAIRKKDLLPLAAGCIWYDYFSAPQPAAPMAGRAQHTDLAADMGKAVFSIPAYVEACQFFLILAPPVAHADFHEQTLDYSSWKERGWCRLERAARVLSPRETHMLLAWKEDTLFQVGSHEYLMDAVGDGVFTVDEDRARLAPVMRTLMENKLQALLQQNNIRGYRRMLASRGLMLRHIPGISPHEVCAPGFNVLLPSSSSRQEVVDAFLRLYGMRSVDDMAGGTAEPILFAARDGNLAVVEGLLHCHANVRARERADEQEYMVLRSHRPLHIAAMFNSDPSIVNLLLLHRASTEDRDCKGIVPLISAACSGHEANVEALLNAGARVSSSEPMGSTSLHVAAMWGREKVLLAAPDADRERRVSLAWCSPVSMLLGVLSVPRWLWGSNSIFSIMACEAEGMSLLMLAALMGRVGEAKALIAAGANPLARNSRGRTAADLAEMAGLQPRIVAYFREPALADELRQMKATMSTLLERLAALEEEEPASPFTAGCPSAYADVADTRDVVQKEDLN